MTNHTVIYRTGGTDNGRWHDTNLSGSQAEMAHEAHAIMHGGRDAIAILVSDLDATLLYFERYERNNRMRRLWERNYLAAIPDGV